MEILVAVTLGLGLTKLVVSCLRYETPIQAHNKVMLESYKALREGRLTRNDSWARK